MKVKISLYAALFLAIGSCIAPFLDIPTRENGANSEKVEVWTVKNEKFHYVKFLIIYCLTILSIINYLYHRVAELCYDVKHVFGKIAQGFVYDFIGNLVVGFGD